MNNIESKKLLNVENDNKFLLFTWIGSISASFLGLYVASVFQGRSFTSMFSRWDAIRFLDVVQNGYREHMPMLNGRILQNRNAFFPGFPTIVRAVNFLLPGNIIFAGVLLNTVLALLGFMIFYHTLLGLMEKRFARKTLLFYAFSPGAFIFYWFYSEALTVLFIISAFYYLSHKKIWLSSMFVALATLTRPNALPFVIMVPIFILITEVDIDFYRLTKLRFKKYLRVIFKAIVSFVISISGFVGFMLFLWNLTTIPNAWLRTEREGWGESQRPFLRTTQSVIKMFSTNSNLNDFFVFFCTVLGILLIIVCLIYVRKNDFSPLMFSSLIPSIIVILLALSNNTAPGSPRFYMVALPAFIPIPYCAKGKNVRYLLLVSWILMLTTSAFYTFANNVA